MSETKEKRPFLELHQQNMAVLGFWSEEYKSAMIHAIETRYRRDVLQDWYISDFIINGDKVLVKWNKRYQSLTEEAVIEKYGE